MVYQPHHQAVIEQDPKVSLDLIVSLVRSAPDDDHLCAIGVILIDPLLDLYWSQIGDQFELAMRNEADLRKAFSCTMLDIPEDLHARLHELVGSSEDIGHSGM
jgi:hypothetical protein